MRDNDVNLPRRLWLRGLAACALTVGVAPRVLHAAPRTYTLAVVPHLLPLAAHRDWTPIAEELGQALQTRVEVVPYRSIPQFEAAVMQGAADFAYMNPYHMLVANRKLGYLPLVRSSHPLTGILLVRQDSPVKNVRELDGQTLAFPAPNSFAASLYLRALLTQEQKIRFKPSYLDTHSEVFRHVIMGNAAAGGAIRFTFLREPVEVCAQLRVLYETPATPPHAFAVHPRVPAAVREQARRTLLAMGKQPALRDRLEAVQLSVPVAADLARDYQPLEKLGLDRYAVPMS
jgi:phosphonate transport system substrate-binding protein